MEPVAEDEQAAEEMVTPLHKRNVNVVFLSAPLAPQFTQYLDTARLERTRTTIRNRVAHDHATYLDYVEDPRFTAADFADPVHLNKDGARKFSRILNEAAIRRMRVCDAGATPPCACRPEPWRPQTYQAPPGLSDPWRSTCTGRPGEVIGANAARTRPRQSAYITVPAPKVAEIPHDSENMVAATLPQTDAAPLTPQYNAR